MHSSYLNHQYRLVSGLMVSGALSAAAAGDLPTGDTSNSSLRNTVLGFRQTEHQWGWAHAYQGLTTCLDDFQCQLSTQ